MKEIAQKYHHLGLSVLPIGNNKRPIIAWSDMQKKRVLPSDEFDRVDKIAIICGAVSSGLECLDVDLKYDVSGNLMQRFKELVNQEAEGLLKKLLVETSVNNGFHFLYRYTAEQYDGNKKLASRYATEEEKKTDPKEKVKVLLETRGEGGYFICAPSAGYKVIQGSFENIPHITIEERNILIFCASQLNEVIQETHKPEKSNVKNDDESPLDDYNKRGDVLQLLLDNGWKIEKQNSKNYFLKRPGVTDSKWSASLQKETNVFYVFSTSTEFNSCEGYSPASVFITLKHKGNVKEAVKELLSLGFGTEKKYTQKQIQKSEPKISKDENDLSFLAPEQKILDYINAVHTNTLQLGLKTGIPPLDDHFRFKRGNFNVIGGHDNVGKTAIMLYLLTQSAMLHQWKWFIVSVENSAGYIYRKIMEYYLCKPTNQMSYDELLQSAKFVRQHFYIVDNENSYTYIDILAMGERMKKKFGIDGIFIDPYNAVEFDESQLRIFGDHNYHYKVTTEFRKFCKTNDCCIYLNCHAVTEALRRVWTKDLAPSSDLVGYPMPPKKSDVEGGGKFANRADDFIILHRYVQSEEKYRITEIHIVKVKEVETGGRITHMNKPVKIQMSSGNCGFIEHESSLNFVTKKYEHSIENPF